MIDMESNADGEQKPTGVSEAEIKSLVQREIEASESNDDSDLSEFRTKALEYFDGKLTDLKPQPGRSTVVSKDLADAVGWIMPGVVKMFMASQYMALAEAVGDDDEEWAKQATMGLNHLFFKENEGYRNLRDSVWDALVLRNAIIKAYYDDTPEYEVSFHSGLTDEALTELIDDDDVDVLQHEASEEMQWVEMVPGQSVEMPVRIHEVKIKRLKTRGRIVIKCIPPEDYLQDADAVTTAEARFRGDRSRKTRSELIEMGFDPDIVEGLSSVGTDKSEKDARDDTFDDRQDAADPSMEEIDLYEVYPCADVDGDGIAERLRVYYAGGEVLFWEVWEDEGPYFDIPCDPIPHRWDGKSISDDTMDVQKNKTALLRAFMDNVYASVNPQRFATGEIVNPEQLFSPTFGGTVFGKANATLTNISVPMVAGTALEALAYQDEVAQRRTGVSRQSMALDPEALQNQSATANQNNKDASQSQVELVARDMAELGWKPVFRALLKLMIRHQNQPKTIRLGKKSVKIDPRHWNADMDVTIDVGLGTGSRDRDMAMLQGILGNQTALIDRFTNSGFPEKALEMVPKVLATLKKLTESAGIRNPDGFFPDLTPEEMQTAFQRIQQMQQQGDPKAAADAEKAQAEQAYRMAKLEADTAYQQQKLQLEMQIQRDRMTAEIQLQRERMQFEVEMRTAGLKGAPSDPGRVGGTVRLGGELG